MGVVTFNDEFTSPLAPSRLFQALTLDNHNLLPKLLPQHITSVEILHGSGEPGSIKQTNFTDGSPFKYVKHRLDFIDVDNYVCKYTDFEGDFLGDKIEKVYYEIKLEAAGGGCVSKFTTHIHTKGDIVLKEDEIKEGKERFVGVYKAVEAYLLANPSVYT